MNTGKQISENVNTEAEMLLEGIRGLLDSFSVLSITHLVNESVRTKDRVHTLEAENAVLKSDNQKCKDAIRTLKRAIDSQIDKSERLFNILRSKGIISEPTESQREALKQERKDYAETA